LLVQNGMIKKLNLIKRSVIYTQKYSAEIILFKITTNNIK